MVINKKSNKNKVRVSIIIMLTMLVIMSVSSLAWVGYPDTPPDNGEIPCYEEHIYQAIFESADGIKLIVKEDPLHLNRYGNIARCGQYYKYENGNWEYIGPNNTVDGLPFTKFLQSTHDIYTDDTLTEVFFSPPKVTTLTQVLSHHPPLSLMSPLIRGISPYLIGLLIVSVAFWKGLQFLSRTLRKG